MTLTGQPRLYNQPSLVTKDELWRHIQPNGKSRASSHALVLTVIRRCGKSSCKARSDEVAVTINLEGTRWYGLGSEDFATILSVLDEDHPPMAIFRDEVQEVPEC